MKCGISSREHLDKYKRTLEIHHRDHDPTNNTLGNLSLLCRVCHWKAHGKEDRSGIDPEELALLYEGGESFSRVGHQYGISRQIAHYIYRKHRGKD